MNFLLLSAASLIAGITYIWAATRNVRPLIYLLKPGTMVLILLLAAGGALGSPAPGYAWAVLAGLSWSLVGDILLMLPQNWFIPGAMSFLVAHLFYIWTLWTSVVDRLVTADATTGVLLALVGAAFFRRVAAGMREQGHDGLLAPAALYMFVISVMVWRAVGALFQPMGLPFRPAIVAAGALLFYASDAALAWDRFIQPLPGRHLIVMGAYFIAQYCFAASVAWPPAG